MILDSHATTADKLEGKEFIKRVKQTERNHNIKTREVIADRGYGYGENLKHFHDRGVHTSIPNFHRNAGGHIDEDKFQYDGSKDIYYCPIGEVLKPTKKSYAGVKKYTTRSGVCKDCPLKASCFPKSKSNRKSLNISIYKMFQDKVRHQETLQEFKDTMRERMWKIEGLFAEAKTHHGLAKARYRGRSKLQIQAYMIASVQNLKRLVKSFVDFLRSFLVSLRPELLFLKKT